MNIKERIHRLANEYSVTIKEFISKFPNYNVTQIAEEIIKAGIVTLNIDYFRKIVAEYCRYNNIELRKGKRDGEVPDEFKDKRTKTKSGAGTSPIEEKVKEPEKKSGFEIKDGYVINWTNNTIVTDLGEFGTYVSSFSRHKLIQNAYVHAGEGDTAAKVAMTFNFPHAKSVYQYAKIHGFTKSSIPQTDFDLENGFIDEESAIEENMQALKLKIYKGTELRKWKETEAAASKWWNFENTIMEDLKVVMSETDQIRAEQLNFIISPTDFKFSSVIGISDIHYLKICYDYKGNITYNREIAKQRIEEHTQKLAEETARYGRPENFYVIVGNDNLHIDGISHSTTKGTFQHEATDGLWRLEFKNYVKIQMQMIEYYKQIAPVVLVPVKGNHDLQSSIALQSFLSLHYSEDPLVNVIDCYDDRCYIQYGTNCFVFTHGDELRSIAKLEREAHKLVLSEAKEQGVNIQEVTSFTLFHGHLHPGSMNDLGGFVERIGLSSLHLGEDGWHRTNGFIGRQHKSQVIQFEPEFGKKGISYV